MSRNLQRRLNLFDKYAKNLEHIKKAGGFDFSIKDNSLALDSNIYICSLSFKFFHRDTVLEEKTNKLTFEHVPPESLGGKPVILTERTLNSQSGHDLDYKILKYIETQEFNKGLKPFETRFKINKNISLNASISLDMELKKPKFSLSSQILHPGAKRFLEIFNKREEFQAEFKLPNYQRSDVGLLKIAYLTAFSELGYSFFFGITSVLNSSIQKIRHQIINKDIRTPLNIPISQVEYPNELSGVSIIHEPKEYRSLMVVFDLILEQSTYRYSVILPGPDSYGTKVYDAIANSGLKSFHFKATTFHGKLNLQDYDESLSYHTTWKKLNGITN